LLNYKNARLNTFFYQETDILYVFYFFLKTINFFYYKLTRI